jgi:hypothetical protein
VKVLSNHCDRRGVGEAVGDTTKKPLVQEELVVFVADAGEHHRYREEKRERDDDNLEFEEMSA